MQPYCRTLASFLAVSGAWGNPPPAEPPRKLETRYELFTRVHANHVRAGDPNPEWYVLHRTRIELAVRPAPGWRLFVQGQDSRAVNFAGSPRPSDGFELNQVYGEFGMGGWRVRVGRHELAFGDERLIGSDSEWCHLGQTFDAIRISHPTGPVELHWFASRPVARMPGKWNRPIPGVGLHGFYSSVKLPAGGLDVYLLLKTTANGQAETGGKGTGGRYTAGFRHTRPLPGGFEGNLEMALQRGAAAGDALRAWAGHWEVTRRLGRGGHAPRLTLEYNYASGDSSSGDGVQTQFDDLFPAAYDRFGLPDPFPWSDLHAAGISATWRGGERWEFVAGLRSLWRASSADGEPGRGRHLGKQFSALASYQASGRWSAYFGYSHLLAVSMPDKAVPTCVPFVGVRYRR